MEYLYQESKIAFSAINSETGKYGKIVFPSFLQFEEWIKTQSKLFTIPKSIKYNRKEYLPADNDTWDNLYFVLFSAAKEDYNNNVLPLLCSSLAKYISSEVVIFDDNSDARFEYNIGTGERKTYSSVAEYVFSNFELILSSEDLKDSVPQVLRYVDFPKNKITAVFSNAKTGKTFKVMLFSSAQDLERNRRSLTTSNQKVNIYYGSTNIDVSQIKETEVEGTLTKAVMRELNPSDDEDAKYYILCGLTLLNADNKKKLTELFDEYGFEIMDERTVFLLINAWLMAPSKRSVELIFDLMASDDFSSFCDDIIELLDNQ